MYEIVQIISKIVIIAAIFFVALFTALRVWRADIGLLKLINPIRAAKRLAENSANNTPLLKISDDRKYIVTENNEPFFWLGGTAWELIHRLNKQEIDQYLTDRAEKGFTIIQTVILAELDGLNTPNAYGEKPLIDNDPGKLNEKYFEYVDYVINRAKEFGLYIALLPTWGDKYNKKWGSGPEIFNSENAEIYGALLAKRYISCSNIIWILGGDRIPENENHNEVIRAMAKGIRKIDSLHLISYHPIGGVLASDYYNENWLDLDMFQSGHNLTGKDYQFVMKSKKSKPVRPVINGEARYENIPDRFWEKDELIWLEAADVRITAYWSMLAGAAGYTYGCNDIWQMYSIDKKPVIHARTDWKVAMHLPGSTHMKYMKELLTTFPWQKMDNDQSLILNENPEDDSYIICAFSHDKDFIIAYTPLGKPINLDISGMKAQKVLAFWYNPRSGKSKQIGGYSITDKPEFMPWSTGKGSDFVLIIIDEKSNYVLPD